MPAISVSHLNYYYGSRKALDDLCFEIAEQSFCGLLGPNGAGKSTLFSLLTRLLVSDQGFIRIAGFDLKRQHRDALSCLGVVFQQPTVELEMTVDQNMGYFAALHGLSGAQVSKRIDESLELLHMRDRRFEKVRSLNGGHRRRMEIARALVHNPKVLLLDEPTVGLDAESRQHITGYVHDLTEMGVAVLWATHLVDEIYDRDQVLILHQGRLRAAGHAAAIAAGDSLLNRFLALTSATGEQQ